MRNVSKEILFSYLNELKRSGSISSVQLMQEFDLAPTLARDVLQDWIKTLNQSKRKQLLECPVCNQPMPSIWKLFSKHIRFDHKIAHRRAKQLWQFAHALKRANSGPSHG